MSYKIVLELPGSPKHYALSEEQLNTFFGFRLSRVYSCETRNGKVIQKTAVITNKMTLEEFNSGSFVERYGLVEGALYYVNPNWREKVRNKFLIKGTKTIEKFKIQKQGLENEIIIKNVVWYKDSGN